MPQFTQWAITNPAPNVLFNPAAVDQAIADTQSKLGDLDIRRQTLGLEQQKLDATQAGNRALLDGNTNPNTAPPADSTPFEQQMGAAEGGSDPAAVNKQGYAGQFQFGSQRLADLGLYTPAPGEGKNEWKGQFHIAPYNVATLDDFLKNPAAQHAAFVAHVANIDDAIANTPGADKFDQNGLRAVAHLGGVQGMRNFVATGGNFNAQDANGTTLKNYYTRFAAGGAPALQAAFGSVHGPSGPNRYTPAVQPGGKVSAAWVDPNAPVPPIPPAGGPPPFNPNAGPRVAGASPAGAPGTIVPPVTGSDPNAPVRIPPVGPARSGSIPPPPGGSADATPIAPSPIALRTGGTDVAGPGAGPDATLPAVAAPNQMYQTGIPGITIGGPPSNTLAPPPPAPAAAAPAATTAPSPMAQAQAAPPAAQRPPLPQLSPPPSRAIQTEPLIQGGPFDGLTQGQAQAARAAGASLVPTAALAAQMQTWRQQNIANRQTAATAAAAQQQAQIAQQQWNYEQQVKAGWEDAGNGVIRNRYTGETKYAGPPTPRIGKDESGRQFEVLPGGGMRYLTDNPSGVTGSGDDASALRLMNEIGPKIANGTATPQEQTNYASATEIYRKPTIVTDAVTKEQRRVYQRDLPQGFPAPPGLGGGAPGQPGASGGAGGSQVVVPGLSPQQQEIERNPSMAKVADQQYERESAKIGDMTKGVIDAQNDNVRIKEMQDVMKGFSSGPGAGWRNDAAAWFQRWAPSAVTGWEKQSANLDGAAAAQVFQKLAFKGSTTQERESSPRGGVQATQLFQKFNPGIDLLDPANKSLLDTTLIANQANIDYGQGAHSHFTTQEENYGQNHKYVPLTKFNEQWINQRNPEVYAGAMGAIAGQPYAQWTRGLQEPEIQRALDIVSRAKPSAVVNGKSGRISMQPQGSQTTPTSQAATGTAAPAPPAVGAVQGGYRFKGGNPASPTSWEAVN